jgi:type IV secretory pathway component VirB8
MTRELITQRIKYLMEEGGLFEDEATDQLRRELRFAIRVIALAAVVCVVELGVIAFRS